MLNLIEYTQENDIPALLVAIDFEKAFDRLEWTMVQKALKFFNFPEYICSWAHIFYNNIESKVVNNGWASDTFILPGAADKDALYPLSVVACQGGGVSSKPPVHRAATRHGPKIPK